MAIKFCIKTLLPRTGELFLQDLWGSLPCRTFLWLLTSSICALFHQLFSLPKSGAGFSCTNTSSAVSASWRKSLGSSWEGRPSNPELTGDRLLSPVIQKTAVILRINTQAGDPELYCSPAFLLGAKNIIVGITIYVISGPLWWAGGRLHRKLSSLSLYNFVAVCLSKLSHWKCLYRRDQNRRHRGMEYLKCLQVHCREKPTTELWKWRFIYIQCDLSF